MARNLPRLSGGLASSGSASAAARKASSVASAAPSLSSADSSTALSSSACTSAFGSAAGTGSPSRAQSSLAGAAHRQVARTISACRGGIEASSDAAHSRLCSARCTSRALLAWRHMAAYAPSRSAVASRAGGSQPGGAQPWKPMTCELRRPHTLRS